MPHPNKANQNMRAQAALARNSRLKSISKKLTKFRLAIRYSHNKDIVNWGSKRNARSQVASQVPRLE